MTTGTKKPKWNVVSFKQIEARRKELSLPKSTMASNLGITNSTYHNWARGKTVPHESQQEQVKAALDSMTGAPARSDASDPRAGAGSARHGSERSGRRRETVAGGSINMPSGFTPTGQSSHHLADSSVRGDEVNGIATITAAYISAQGGPVAKEVVFDFISGLQKALHPVVLSAIVASPAKADEPVPVATG